MPDWTKSMQQTFECYTVDPGTWKDIRPVNGFKSATVDRDSSSDTLGSASIDIAEDLGECYLRIYLVTIQNGLKERFPLGTFLAQTIPTSFDGKIQTISVDAYTPLIELKENPVPIGYYVPENNNVMDTAYAIVRDHVRAPVVKTSTSDKVYGDFVANTNDNWLTFTRDLIANAKYEFSLDEIGRILFSPKQPVSSLQPVWTYTDDNSSILYPSISRDYDLYGIPNVVEVIYSQGNSYYYTRVSNDDVNSPLSTVNRGREIIHRVTDPELVGNPTKKQIDEYARQVLEDLSSLDQTITYKHGYCPVRVGDCVRLNYTRAGLRDVKAKVISQTISCTSGCVVTEKALFTKKMWKG